MLREKAFFILLFLCIGIHCFSQENTGVSKHSGQTGNESVVQIKYFKEYEDYNAGRGIPVQAEIHEINRKQGNELSADYIFTSVQGTASSFLQDSVLVVKFGDGYYINKKRLHRGKANFGGGYTRLYLGNAGELYFVANYIEQASPSYSWHNELNGSGGLDPVYHEETEEGSWQALYVYGGETLSAILVDSRLLRHKLVDNQKLLDQFLKVKDTYKNPRHRASVVVPLLQKAGMIL